MDTDRLEMQQPSTGHLPLVSFFEDPAELKIRRAFMRNRQSQQADRRIERERDKSRQSGLDYSLR